MNSSSNFSIDAFIVGMPKCASTWIYQCFMEHDEIYVPESDSIKYFDLNYHRGAEWYKQFYAGAKPGQIKVDPTPSYLRSQRAIKHIAKDCQNAKFILSLRNPVDRAFSQYWHEKKGGIVNLNFNDIFDHFMLWDWFIETGFYATHLENFFKYFSKEQVFISLFDKLRINARQFIKDIFAFLDVNDTFEPSIIHQKVNKADVVQNKTIRTLRSVPRDGLIGRSIKPIRKIIKQSGLKEKVFDAVSNKNEYDQGLGEETRNMLIKIYLPEIERLENLIDRDLSNWKQ